MKSLLTQARARARTQNGFTLIEVLVAILIFSFGLLGFVGLQARSVQFSTSAEDRNRAALLANDMASTITLYTVGATASAPTDAYNAWVTRVATPASGGLPNGVGSVAATASANVLTVSVTWVPTNAASNSTPNQFVTQVITNP